MEEPYKSMTAKTTRDKAALMRLLEQERKKLNDSIQRFGPASEKCLEQSRSVDVLLEKIIGEPAKEE